MNLFANIQRPLNAPTKNTTKKKRIPTNEEIDAFIFIGLTGSIIAYPILMIIFLMVVVGPKG